jgi:flagellum-specific ATP synthase
LSRFGEKIIIEINRLSDNRMFGQVKNIVGLLVEIGGFQGNLSIGDYCIIFTRTNKQVKCEVVGFSNGNALVMPFDTLDGIGMGCRAEVGTSESAIFPNSSWLGRVLNASGEPIDGKGALAEGSKPYLIRGSPPAAHTRQRVGRKLDLGIRAINTFLTCCQGQRMGVFAGSGIGKSSILSMMARHTNAEVNVIGLVGERGREAREFIEDHLGEEGLAKSVVVVATSDESALVRRQAAYMTMAVAEYFRDQRKQVLCMMDSVTRFAMAQREISLSVGEPPTSKGYTPSVFAELPRLLERAGPGAEGQGSITGLFTILVEGDDHNEPVADAVRGILDGHIILERDIAERGRFPAINILRSVSRTMPGCNTADQNELIAKARQLMSVYEDMAELIRLGAYRRGSDLKVDEAIRHHDALERFLSQEIEETTDLNIGYTELANILGLEMSSKHEVEVPVPQVQPDWPGA